MSTDPIVLGRIIAQQPESVAPAEQTAQSSASAQRETFVTGQVLQARVAAILATQQQILLEIAGTRLQASGLSGLIEGQALTVRIAGVQPSLTLEVLAERTPAEQHLATALKNLFSGNQTSPKLWTNLQNALQQLQSLPQSARPGVPDALIQSVIQKLQPLTVSQSAVTSAAAVRAAFSRIGLDLESTLRSAAGEQTTSAVTTGELKAALGRLAVALQQITTIDQATATTQGQSAEISLNQASIERLLAAVDRIINRFERAAGAELQRSNEAGIARATGGENQRSLELPVLRSLRLQASPDLARQLLPLLRSVRSSLAGFAKVGSEHHERLRTVLEALRIPVAMSGGVSGETARAAANVQGEMARLADDIEAILNRNAEGRAMLQRIALDAAARNAGNAHERIEAFQVLNSHLGERSQQLHLFLPVAFADEITEMQLKQFSGKGEGANGENKSLTVVMLLQLESLGALRIDALAQEKALYINVFVERPEVKPVVEELATDFGKQLKARGFSLARLVCRTDDKKIKQFHALDGDLLADDEGLVDMKI